MAVDASVAIGRLEVTKIQSTAGPKPGDKSAVECRIGSTVYVTCNWYSMTGSSSDLSSALNCLLAAEYLTAIVTHIARLHQPIPVIPTRPPESAPSVAPNLLRGS